MKLVNIENDFLFLCIFFIYLVFFFFFFGIEIVNKFCLFFFYLFIFFFAKFCYWYFIKSSE